MGRYQANVKRGTESVSAREKAQNRKTAVRAKVKEKRKSEIQNCKKGVLK